MIGLLLITLVLLNNATYPGGTVNVTVQGNGTLKLLDNCTYFCGYNSNLINVTGGNYTICVSYSCKEGNYSIIADGKSYNFTVLKPTYDYLRNSTVRLELEKKKLEKKVEMLNETIYKLKKENEELQDKLDDYVNLTAKLKNENSKLRSEINELEYRISQLESKVKELESDKNYLESTLEVIQNLYHYSKLALTFILAFVVGSYVAIVRR